MRRSSLLLEKSLKEKQWRKKASYMSLQCLHHPTPRKDSSGNEELVKSKVVTEVTRILAGSPDEVSILAARSIPDQYLDKINEIEIVVRPF